MKVKIATYLHNGVHIISTPEKYLYAYPRSLSKRLESLEKGGGWNIYLLTAKELAILKTAPWIPLEKARALLTLNPNYFNKGTHEN